MNDTENAKAVQALPEDVQVWVVGTNSPVAQALIKKRRAFEVFSSVRTDTGIWRHVDHAAAAPIGILSSERWCGRLACITIVQTTGDPVYRLTVQANSGTKTFKVQEHDLPVPGEVNLGQLSIRQMRTELTVEGDENEFGHLLELRNQGHLRKINRRKLPGGRIRMTVDVANGHLEKCKEGKLLWISKSYRMAEGVSLHVTPEQWHEVAKILADEPNLRGCVTRESPRWAMIGGNRGKIVDFLQDQRACGNITSDIMWCIMISCKMIPCRIGYVMCYDISNTRVACLSSVAS